MKNIRQCKSKKAPLLDANNNVLFEKDIVENFIGTLGIVEYKNK